MTFPNPQVVEILAEIADASEDHVIHGAPVVIHSLANVAGAAERAVDSRMRGELVTVTAEDERRALVRLAAHCVARIETLNGKGAKN